MQGADTAALRANRSMMSTPKGRYGLFVTAPVSIHAPVKGRLRDSFPSDLLIYSFNPRPREGATLFALTLLNSFFRFNPRPREGATKLGQFIALLRAKFQSTPP